MTGKRSDSEKNSQQITNPIWRSLGSSTNSFLLSENTNLPMANTYGNPMPDTHYYGPSDLRRRPAYRGPRPALYHVETDAGAYVEQRHSHDDNGERVSFFQIVPRTPTVNNGIICSDCGGLQASEPHEPRSSRHGGLEAAAPFEPNCSDCGGIRSPPVNEHGPERARLSLPGTDFHAPNPAPAFVRQANMIGRARLYEEEQEAIRRSLRDQEVIEQKRDEQEAIRRSLQDQEIIRQEREEQEAVRRSLQDQELLKQEREEQEILLRSLEAQEALLTKFRERRAQEVKEQEDVIRELAERLRTLVR